MTSKIKILILGLFTVSFVSLLAQHNVERMNDTETTKKISTLLHLINGFYVDTLNMPDLTEKMIALTLKELDPHSSYISKDDVKMPSPSDVTDLLEHQASLLKDILLLPIISYKEDMSLETIQSLSGMQLCNK